MSQYLTLAGVKRAALAFYKKRKLTAQHPEQFERECVYHKGPYCCAVGAALNKKSVGLIDERGLNGGTSVGGLMDHDVIHTKTSAVASAIEEIQNLHDAWANASHNHGSKHPLTVQARKDFLAAITK